MWGGSGRPDLTGHAGSGWHWGQRKLERFMNASRTIGVPQRVQG